MSPTLGLRSRVATNNKFVLFPTSRHFWRVFLINRNGEPWDEEPLSMDEVGLAQYHLIDWTHGVLTAPTKRFFLPDLFFIEKN
jgi:hypothetical protein